MLNIVVNLTCVEKISWHNSSNEWNWPTKSTILSKKSVKPRLLPLTIALTIFFKSHNPINLYPIMYWKNENVMFMVNIFWSQVSKYFETILLLSQFLYEGLLWLFEFESFLQTLTNIECQNFKMLQFRNNMERSNNFSVLAYSFKNNCFELNFCGC